MMPFESFAWWILDIMPSVPQAGETCLLKTINSPKIKDKCRAGCDVFSCEPMENTVGHIVMHKIQEIDLFALQLQSLSLGD